MAFIHRINYTDLPNFDYRLLIFYLNLSLIVFTNPFAMDLNSKEPDYNELDYNMDYSFLPSWEQMD
jgi:hypothetical protein